MNINDYVQHNVEQFKQLNFDILECDTDNIGALTMIIRDENNSDNQYRVVINDDLVSIQYIVDYEIFDLIAVHIFEFSFQLLIQSMVEFIEMSLNYYMRDKNFIVYKNESE